MRTLIVDDDPVCRTLLKHALKEFGPVEFASNGVEAIAEIARYLAAGERFDLVMLDITMPGINGHQTLPVIRRLEERFGVARPCTIAMISANRDRDSIFASFREQADLYFTKPIQLDRVMDDLRADGLISRTA